MRNRLRGRLLLSGCLWVLVSALAFAAGSDGEPDPLFGSSGRAVMSLGNWGYPFDTVAGLVLAPGGDLYLAAGSWGFVGAELQRQNHATVAFLSSGGATDPDWGNFGGLTYAQFDTGFEPGTEVTALGTTDDGGLLVAGSGDRPGIATTHRNFSAVRLDGDGLTVDSWGNGMTAGTAVVAFDLTPDGEDRLASVLPLPGGAVLMVGTAQWAGDDHDLAFARLTPAGELDATFGTAGKLTIAFDAISGGTDVAAEARFGDAGRILVASTVSGTDGTPDLAITRHLASGVLDATFGDDGKRRLAAIPGLPTEDRATSIAPTPDGGALVAGSFVYGGLREPILARLDVWGEPEGDFGSLGRVLPGLPAGFDQGEIERIRLDAVGRLVAAGWLETPSGRRDGFVLRLRGNGCPDPDFGSGGWVILRASEGAERDLVLDRLEIDAAGRLIAAGSVDSGTATGQDSLVVRLLAGASIHADGFECRGLEGWSLLVPAP